MKNLYKRKSNILARQLRLFLQGFDGTTEMRTIEFELAWLRFWIAFISFGGLIKVFRVWVFIFGCSFFTIRNKWEFIIWAFGLFIVWFVFLVRKFRKDQMDHEKN